VCVCIHYKCLFRSFLLDVGVVCGVCVYAYTTSASLARSCWILLVRPKEMCVRESEREREREAGRAKEEKDRERDLRESPRDFLERARERERERESEKDLRESPRFGLGH